MVTHTPEQLTKQLKFQKQLLKYIPTQERQKLWKGDFPYAEIDRCDFNESALGSVVFDKNDLTNSTFKSAIIYKIIFHKNVLGVPK